jgi:hypothetical protein
VCHSVGEQSQTTLASMPFRITLTQKTGFTWNYVRQRTCTGLVQRCAVTDTTDRCLIVQAWWELV